MSTVVGRPRNASQAVPRIHSGSSCAARSEPVQLVGRIDEQGGELASLGARELLTIWGPQVPGEPVASVRDGLPVGVQITLGCCQGAVAGDLSESVHGHAGIGHPRKPGVPRAVALQVLVAELRDDCVPGCGVAFISRMFISSSYSQP
jgi:hypothetical protein